MSDPYFPPEHGALLEADPRPSIEAYNEAHRDFVIGYTDIVPHNPATGEFFFPIRDLEMRDGVWFFGGRMAVGETVQQSAARHFGTDTGIEIEPGRFTAVSHMGIADFKEATPEDPAHSRHAADTVLVVELYPDEVTALNERSEKGFVREVSGGRWYKPNEAGELKGPLREFMREYFQRQVLMDALRDEALIEDGDREREQRYPAGMVKWIKDPLEGPLAIVTKDHLRSFVDARDGEEANTEGFADTIAEGLITAAVTPGARKELLQKFMYLQEVGQRRSPDYEPGIRADKLGELVNFFAHVHMQIFDQDNEDASIELLREYADALQKPSEATPVEE